MTGTSIVSRFAVLPNRLPVLKRPGLPLRHPDLHALWQQQSSLPGLITASAVAMRYLALLGPLAWQHIPERDLKRNWGQQTVPYAAFAAACLIKLNEARGSMTDLHTFLVDHPLLVWLTGFPLIPDPRQPHGFDAAASVPTQRHLTRLLRTMPNAIPKCLLADSVHLILAELAAHHLAPPQCIAVDTKAIWAWVKENNPKAYMAQRFNQERQPAGDPDCKLGCKRRHNQLPAGRQPASSLITNPVPADHVQVGEFYWGYGSGLVAAKIPGWGEFVIAELTQTFDQPDVSYFFPLMAQVQQHLGYKPHWAALDAAFDAWYIHDFFHRPDDPSAFAAIPFVQKGKAIPGGRHFSPDGLPLCEAGLPMPLQLTFTDRTTCIVEHERGKYVCPRRFPQTSADDCPVTHKLWAQGGCTATMPTSVGARLRYTLDRHSDAYRLVYSQRTAVERINSQAVGLGIERPHIRNGAAIANLNTLIYVLINLRFLQRLRLNQPLAA